MSIVIPVLNEAETINTTLICLPSQPNDLRLEVLVVDGDPHGTTLMAIQSNKAWPFLLKTERSDRGRAIQMNQGANMAAGPVLLFLHADTLLPKGALDVVTSTMQNPQIVGGAFDLGIQSSHWGYRIIEAVGRLRSRVTRLPYGDQAIFVRKDYFHQIGGFSQIPIMEDVDLMQRIKKNGDAIEIISKSVKTSPRRWEKEGIVYGTLRNWVLLSLYLMGVSPYKLAKYYRTRP